MIVQALKVLTPVFSGIVGVFITSSLVSKNAEDKEKEKPLTRLKDEDPIIEEYEDANEGKCDKTKSDCKGGSQGGQKSESEGGGQSGGSSKSNQSSEEGEKGEGSQGGQKSESEEDDSTEQEDEEGKSDDEAEEREDEEKGEGSQGGQKSESEEDDSTEQEDEEGKSDDEAEEREDEEKGLPEGSEEAENVNAYGSKNGTIDRAMTKQELTSLRNMSTSLTDMVSILSSLVAD